MDPWQETSLKVQRMSSLWPVRHTMFMQMPQFCEIFGHVVQIVLIGRHVLVGVSCARQAIL
jgi:hypothetical protein